MIDIKMKAIAAEALIRDIVRKCNPSCQLDTDRKCTCDEVLWPAIDKLREIANEPDNQGA